MELSPWDENAWDRMEWEGVWRGWQKALAQGGSVCYQTAVALCQPLVTVVTVMKTVRKLGLQSFNALGPGLGMPGRRVRAG